MENSEDNFEYHLLFPPALTCTLDLPRLRVKSENLKKNNDIVVILLGWAGSKDKHLSKYSKIYEEEGYTVLRCASPMPLFFGKDSFSKLTKHVEKLAEVVHDHDLRDKKLIFHIFSNGGASIYERLTCLLMKEGPLEVKGIAYDSCPALMSFKGSCMALWPSMEGTIFFKRVLYTLLGVLYIWLSYFWFKLTGEEKSKGSRFGVYNNLKSRPKTGPELFIYSKADCVTEHSSICQFAMSREKEEGVSVTHVIFDDSPHVGHFPMHQESYQQHVHTFLEDCHREIDDQ